MRNSILISAIFLVFLSGCSKRENVFSCDPEINEWAMNNSEKFSGITREQLATLAPAIQKAVYRTLTAKEKYDLWIEKLNIVKSSDLNSDFVSEISQLFDRIKEDWYVSNTYQSISVEDSCFLANWEHQLLFSGKIDSTNYVINFCMLMTKAELYRMLDNPDEVDHSWIVKFELPKKFYKLKAAPGQDCSCRYNIYCNLFGAADCEHGGCNQVRDCGLLGQSKCLGLCPEEIIEE